MSISTILLGFLSVSEAYPTADCGPQVPGFDYKNQKIRGANLGGWFVLEPWINPSFFSHGWNGSSEIPVDEYHVTKNLGKEEASKVMNHHWDTWINETDFENLAQWGFNFVRIPIGYWAFLDRPEDPYVQGQLKYLDRALEWARKHDIKAWIDMHGVPGSQNGADNSGLRDSYQWQNTSTTNLYDTYFALEAIIDKYGNKEFEDVVIGIEPVNEPIPLDSNTTVLHEYYDKSYELIRRRNAFQGAVFHDAFEPTGFIDKWFNTSDHNNIIIDHHYYEWLYSSNLTMTTDEHVQYACAQGRDMKQNDTHLHVVGEWSAAMTDCQPYLRGVGHGSIYDGSYNNTKPIGSCDAVTNITKWSDEDKDNTRKFVEAQLDAFEYGGSGWSIWTYKAEKAVAWDLRRLIEYGMFPNPVTDRKFKNQCGY